MLSTNGKNPLVAATYYFNPGGSLLRGAPTNSGSGIQSGLDSGQFDSSSSLEGKSTKVSKRDRRGGIDDGNGSCSSADGRKGSCYEATECVSRGGTPMGSCNPTDSGSVCCICKCWVTTHPVELLCYNLAHVFLSTSAVDVTCGDSVGERYVYVRNPQFPSSDEKSRMCRVRITKSSQSICQFRLDLLHFDIAPPNHGNCSQDTFVVSGQNENNIIPKICGLNTGQHCKYFFCSFTSSHSSSLEVSLILTNVFCPFPPSQQLLCSFSSLDFFPTIYHRLLRCRRVRSCKSTHHDAGNLRKEVSHKFFLSFFLSLLFLMPISWQCVPSF